MHEMWKFFILFLNFLSLTAKKIVRWCQFMKCRNVGCYLYGIIQFNKNVIQLYNHTNTLKRIEHYV